MNYDDILEGAWLLLKFAHDEWGILTPQIPNLNMTPAQIKQYKDLRSRQTYRVKKTHQLAELMARLDVLYMYDDVSGFPKVIEAFEETIKKMRSKG